VALLAVAAVLVVGAAWLLRPSTPPTLAQQAAAVAAELRCPDCEGLSVADSPTRAAAEIRRQIDEQLAAGRSPGEVVDSFVARYGEWIRLTPPGPASWLVPLAATALGAIVLGWWLVGRRRGAPAGPPAGPAVLDPSPAMDPLVARRWAWAMGLGLVALLAVGLLLPPPLGLAAETVVNQPLAEALAAEAERRDEIVRLLDGLAEDPTDTTALSELADVYLAGSTAEDLQRAAVTLIALNALEPDEPAHLARLITAYIRASDWADAESATDALEALDPDTADVPFFRGVIAWQGHGDAAAAMAAFDEFLARAPDDVRAAMVRALRAEAAAD
jgi:cytochrome c-type biogenesis protein CcmH